MRSPRHFRRSAPPRPEGGLPDTNAVPVSFKGFRGGYDARDRREDVGEDSSPDCSDFEVSDRDTLIRMEGIATYETYPGRSIRGMIAHPTLDRKTELLLFDADSIGVKFDAGVVWTDIGLADTGEFASGLHGEELIFTDGISTYMRKPREAPTVIEGAPVARSYTSFAGRVFALNVFFAGAKESLGVVWSGSSSQVDDWDGLGSGFELLIQEAPVADYGVALKAMNMNFMAIMLRNAIWVGRRTGIANRPVDFEPRVQGVGPINERVCQTTPLGVIFLSDTGVRIFDGNQAPVVSQPINDSILPLDYEQADSYSSMFDAQRGWYYLFTPTETWILDMQQMRWYRKSLVAHFATMFATQIPIVTWESMVGQTWEDLAGSRWEDYATEEEYPVIPYFLSTVVGAPTLGYADRNLETYFGSVVNPYWEFRRAEGFPQKQAITYDRVQVEYKGYGTLRVYVPNIDGEMSLVVTEALANVATAQVTDIPMIRTGRGAGLRLEVTAGRPEIHSASMIVVPRSMSMKPLPFLTREYEEEF